MSERNKFEDWFERELNKHANFSTHMGIYLDVGVSAAWKAWQASANRQGYKLVPVEPSKACLNNLGNVIFDNFGTTTTEVDRCAEKAYKAMLDAVEN